MFANTRELVSLKLYESYLNVLLKSIHLTVIACLSVPEEEIFLLLFVRVFYLSPNQCNLILHIWNEDPNSLLFPRWYWPIHLQLYVYFNAATTNYSGTVTVIYRGGNVMTCNENKTFETTNYPFVWSVIHLSQTLFKISVGNEKKDDFPLMSICLKTII